VSVPLKVTVEVQASEVPDNISIDAMVDGPDADGLKVHVEGGGQYSAADALKIATAIADVHDEAVRMQAALFASKRRRP
jgi:hypothetical protein